MITVGIGSAWLTFSPTTQVGMKTSGAMTHD